MATEVWVATAPIFFGYIRAYSTNDVVPDSTVAARDLDTQGLVERRMVADPGTRPHGVDPATQAELDNAIGSRAAMTDVFAGDGKFRADKLPDSVPRKGDLVVSTRDYGVKADGITDDFDAMQAAINGTPDGGTLLVQAGDIALLKAGGGGLAIPARSRGVNIVGAGKGRTRFLLSAEVLRCFDFSRTADGQVFQHITLKGFTVDARNVGSTQVGPATTATAGLALPDQANTTIPVASTAGWATKGRLYFPATNSGAADRAFGYNRISPTQLQILNYSGSAVTVAAGDVVRGAVSDHVIVGTLFSGGRSVAYNMYFDDITIEDIDAINVPTVHGASLTASQTGHFRAGVWISPQGNPSNLPATPMTMTNIAIRRCRVLGGEVGFYVASNGTSPNRSSGFIDKVTFEDLEHDALVKPVNNYTSLNFMIGGSGWGDSVRLLRCVGRNSGDVGIETDALMDVLVEDCDIRDAWGGNYFSVNYNAPAKTTTGPPTTTLTAGATAAATALTVAAVPTSIARSGWLVLGGELLSYAVASSTSLTVRRGLNNTTAAAYSSGDTVTFIEVAKQRVHYKNCKSTHTGATVVNGWMPKGWYQLRNSLYPHPRFQLTRGEYENYSADLGQQNSGGTAEAVFLQGEMMSADIDGFVANRHGINHTGNNRGALIGVYSHSGANRTPTLLRFRDLDIKVSGFVSPGTYRVITLDTGSWALDWKNIRVQHFLSTSAGAGYTSLLWTTPSGSNSIDGKMEDLYFGNPSGGDNAPQCLTVGAFPACNVMDLQIRNVDVYDLRYATNATNSNYSPFGIDATNLPKVSIQGVRHSSSAFSSAYPRDVVARTAVVATPYAMVNTDYYIGVSVAGAAVVNLLPVAHGSTAAMPKLNGSRSLVVVDESGSAGTSNITINPASGETIDGAASYVINTNRGRVALMSIPGGWKVLST